MPRNQTPVSPRSSIKHFTVRLPQRAPAGAIEDANQTDASSESEGEAYVVSPTRRATRAAVRQARRGRASVDRAVADAGVASTRAQIRQDHGTREQQEKAERDAQTAADKTMMVRKAVIHSLSQNRRRSSGKNETTLEDLRQAQRRAQEMRSEQSPQVTTDTDTDRVQCAESPESSAEKQQQCQPPEESSNARGDDDLEPGPMILTVHGDQDASMDPSDDATEAENLALIDSIVDSARPEGAMPGVGSWSELSMEDQYIHEAEREREADAREGILQAATTATEHQRSAAEASRVLAEQRADEQRVAEAAAAEQRRATAEEARALEEQREDEQRAAEAAAAEQRRATAEAARALEEQRAYEQRAAEAAAAEQRRATAEAARALEEQREDEQRAAEAAAAEQRRATAEAARALEEQRAYEQRAAEAAAARALEEKREDEQRAAEAAAAEQRRATAEAARALEEQRAYEQRAAEAAAAEQRRATAAAARALEEKREDEQRAAEAAAAEQRRATAEAARAQEEQREDEQRAAEAAAAEQRRATAEAARALEEQRAYEQRAAEAAAARALEEKREDEQRAAEAAAAEQRRATAEAARALEEQRAYEQRAAEAAAAEQRRATAAAARALEEKREDEQRAAEAAAAEQRRATAEAARAQEEQRGDEQRAAAAVAEQRRATAEAARERTEQNARERQAVEAAQRRLQEEVDQYNRERAAEQHRQEQEAEQRRGQHVAEQVARQEAEEWHRQQQIAQQQREADIALEHSRAAENQRAHQVDQERRRGEAVLTTGQQQQSREQERRWVDDHESEDSLDVEHTEQEWADFDVRFEDTNIRVAFNIDTPTVSVPAHGLWGLDQLAKGITQVCGARGVQFKDGGLHSFGGATPQLIGNPLCQDRHLWRLMRRGYVRVHGVTIWMHPLSTSRQQSNLDLIELEYRNPNHLSVTQLRKVLNHWGSLEPLIVSHGPSSRRHTRWPSIMCVNDATVHPRSGEISYEFRLCFEDAGTANRVYSAFLRQEYVENLAIPHAITIELRPVTNTEWCPRRQQLIRPNAPEELRDLNRRLHIFGFRPELTTRQVEQHLAQLGYSNVTIAIQRGRTSGVATTADPATADRLCEAYGPSSRARITIGNIRLFVNRPGENGGMTCFGCRSTGHFRRDCPDRGNSTWGDQGKQLVRYQTQDARSRMSQRPESWLQRGRAGRGDQNGVASGWRTPPGSSHALTTNAPAPQRGFDPEALIQQTAPLMRTLIAEQVREQAGAMVGELRAEVTTHARDVTRQMETQASEIAAIRTAQNTAAANTASIFDMLTNMQQYFGQGNHARGARLPHWTCAAATRAVVETNQQAQYVPAPVHRRDQGFRADTAQRHVEQEEYRWEAVRAVDEHSSDDESNSEDEDHRIEEEATVVHATRRHTRGRRHGRRTWRPERARFDWTAPGEQLVADAIRTREYYAEQFIGDRGDPLETSMERCIRVATSNINKGIMHKLDGYIRTWFLANQMDFMAVADVGLTAQAQHTIWVRSVHGTKTPGMMMVANARAAVIFEQQRWESRWKRADTQYSSSGRSVALTFRLGTKTDLQVIATYCPHSPHENKDETDRERAWIAQVEDRARTKGSMVLLAGDFNAYPDEEWDRQTPGVRPRVAQHTSNQFREWTQDTHMLSTFKQRHPATARFTYANGDTRTALDDIYVSAAHASSVMQSGIWLYSLHDTDHVGTPFVMISLTAAQQTQHRLKEVKAIRRIDTKSRTHEEKKMFALQVEEQLATGRQHLIALPPEPATDEETQGWLQRAIENLNKCMYSAAKTLWGETSQVRREIDRAVSIKRSVRCQGQLRAAARHATSPEATGATIERAARAICWPKWVLLPARIPPTSAHAPLARALAQWRGTPTPDRTPEARAWLDQGIALWKRTLRARRDWRTRRRLEARARQREQWMKIGDMRKLLRATLGGQLPPVSIRGALGAGGEYVESRAAVEASMQSLLDNWIPPDERTEEPRHLYSDLDSDVAELPTFVREWMLRDIERGGTRQQAFQRAGSTWEEFVYDEEMQAKVNKTVSKGVSPGFGGVSQELWVAAPAAIRARERDIFNRILRSGIAPAILNHRQMIFLPKSDQATGVWDRRGLPPWRPITVQSALTTRLFTAISGYLENLAPNHKTQHGFQRDKTVQDAALATTLLVDRATRKKEPLYLLSKDCAKCYDRIPRWVMHYIYRRLGVPPTLLNILMAFLSAGQIDVRTAYGWVSGGVREFGLGQGSVLSIRHIGYYMDVLMEQQENGPDGVSIRHHQSPDETYITGTVLVDDVIDVAVSRAGIESRVAVSNVFTGIHGTGGVFGASKSFLLHHEPGDSTHEDTVYLNDGKGVPQAVTVVSPAEGFKHLGVVQSTADVWSRTISSVAKQLHKDAAAIVKAGVSASELRYIVNHVWLPRLVYRTQLGSAIKVMDKVDSLIRRTVRRILRIPLSTPVDWFYDKTHGLGLSNCVDTCHVTRVHCSLRIMNTPHIPAYHLLTEAFEDYQIQAGLTEHPLQFPIAPPPHLQQWVHQTIRAAAATGVRLAVQWTNPPAAQTDRPNDRALAPELDDETRRRLLEFNLATQGKLRFVGDVADDAGRLLITTEAAGRRWNWTARARGRFADIEPSLRAALCEDGSRRLAVQIGKTRLIRNHIRMPTVDVAPGGYLVVSQFDVLPDNRGLVLRGHELGCRIGDRCRQDGSGLGVEIDVQWWHERNPNSGVWTIRPGSRLAEWADVCIPVQVTPISRRQVIIWRDTIRNHITGSEDRWVIEESFQRSVQRFEEALETGTVAAVDRTCTECHRRCEPRRCPTCNAWHHSQCLPCPVAARAPYGDQWVMRQLQVSPPRAIRAGDGSVKNGGTPNAAGGWGLVHARQSQVGRLELHWADVTSTRCECHALIAGLAASGDTGTQICDNKAAITILATARAIATGQVPTHIKYSNKHRVEIRSMVKLMRPGGDFSAVWVRSHQETTYTADQHLTNQRVALAEADAKAAESYTITDMQSYTDLVQWDAAHALDEWGRPITGNVLAALRQSQQNRRKNFWIALQTERGPSRMTVQQTSVATPVAVAWNYHQQRFYWRAITHTLHTNAAKHRLNTRWSAACRLCNQNERDTQDHRFGLAPAACVETASLHAETTSALQNVSASQWIPDQDYYLPGRATAVARATGLPQRPLWRQASVHQRTQSPLINVQADVWLHAMVCDDLLSDLRHLHFAAAAFLTERNYRHAPPAGRLLPRAILRAVQRCAPDAAALGAHPSQTSRIWRSGVLAHHYTVPDTALRLPAPDPEQRTWWCDDTFIPASTAVWEERARDMRVMGVDSRLWVACYESTPGFSRANANAVTWYLKIPVGELRMRTAASVHQTATIPSGRPATRNPRVIYIGVIASAWSPAEHAAVRANLEAVVEQRHDWWVDERRTQQYEQRPSTYATVAWAMPGQQTADPTEPSSREWIQLRHPDVYATPDGCRRFPSITPALQRWAADCTHTSTEAKAWMHAVIRAIWAANQRHWNHTCTANAAAITAAGDSALLAEVNDGIRTGRRSHQGTRPALLTAIDRHTETLHVRAQTWQASRAATLVARAAPPNSGDEAAP